ncbi:hypothetical protein J6590_009864 [Homalodisca vitripennis]|nr:hypothetical protein J6590_009864 [Homalodisca vitripennis]
MKIQKEHALPKLVLEYVQGTPEIMPQASSNFVTQHPTNSVGTGARKWLQVYRKCNKCVTQPTLRLRPVRLWPGALISICRTALLSTHLMKWSPHTLASRTHVIPTIPSTLTSLLSFPLLIG